MKEDRIEFRTSNQERRQFEMAASFLGMNLSAFLRMAALERASEIIKESHSLMLSSQDMHAFMEAIEDPPKPNKNLKKAFVEYKKRQIG